MRCAECRKGRLRRGTAEIQTKVGPWLVTDPKARVYLCNACDSFEIESKELGRVEFRAALATLTECEDFDGAMLKAVRRILGLTQRDLAEKLSRRHETICRDEQAEALDQELRFAMLGLLASQTRPEGVTLERVG